MFENRFNIISLTDWHVPYHDPKALAAAFSFCERVQPQILVVHECHDFYSISRFDKDPERLNSLQDEIDQVTGYFKILRQTCPESRIILLKSNHLDRLRKYLWRQAPALNSLRALKVTTLLELEKSNIEYMDTLCYKDVLFKHGDLVRKDSGMTARAEFGKEGMSGVSGHTHRLASHYRRLRGGEYVWLESGCLCNLEPEYVNGTVDWQHGLSLVSFKNERSRKYFATAVPIVDYEIPL
jgi:hypothetical protein